ncbi:MAG: TraR/DksA C4-type zinc finger protein [Desulfurococcales archaeon]|nr:TraR/DksA C4-type zinc finger protein [Desulfurococcales archaeon]
MVSKELIERARLFHGHVCPFLVLGLRASEIAMEKLSLRKPGVVETVREDILAIVEVNNCFADGVQVATGCTFGNNSLIYVDLGKNALTLLKRGEGRGVRVYVDAEELKKKYFSREVNELFEKVVVRREGSEKEIRKLQELWEELGYMMADMPEDEFVIHEVEVVEGLERAPIFESIRCSRCGELVMSTRVVYVGGEPLCLACAGRAANAVVGRGISVLHSPIYKVLRSWRGPT